MKKFTLGLLVINIVTFSWLVIGARMELPPWEQAFVDARASVDNLKQTSDMASINQTILHTRIETAETWSRITIEEYRRSEVPQMMLTVINIFGLAVIALKNRKNNPKPAHPMSGNTPV